MFSRISSTFFVVCAVFVTSGYQAKTVRVFDGDVITPRIDIQRKKYEKNENQTWLLDARTGYWALIFHFISIEKESKCRHDYIEIRERPERPVMIPPTRYCGEVLPMPYISKSSRLTVRFVSDHIWEGEGFNITVLYGDSKELLESKSHYAALKHTDQVALQTENHVAPNKDSSPGLVFYILIGASSVALVLFFILLAYFWIAMQKQAFTHETRVPKLHYISGSTGHPVIARNDGTFVRLKSSTNTLDVQELCQSGKKRYLKKTAAAESDVCDTATLKSVAYSNKTHHNNLYVESGK